MFLKYLDFPWRIPGKSLIIVFTKSLLYYIYITYIYYIYILNESYLCVNKLFTNEFLHYGKINIYFFKYIITYILNWLKFILNK